eukprot:2901403-Karenia_brevis.AAC.1
MMVVMVVVMPMLMVVMLMMMMMRVMVIHCNPIMWGGHYTWVLPVGLPSHIDSSCGGALTY